MIVVLVSGSRTLNNRKLVFDTLTRVHQEKKIECILHGACPNRKDPVTGEYVESADMLAQKWAISYEIPYFGVPAKWNTGTAGKGEGPIRNQLMADMQPHYAVIFPGNKGTQDLLERVKTANIPYEIVENK